MITIIGTAKEIADIVQDLSPSYPAEKLRSLTPGEWSYTRAEVAIKIYVMEEQDNG